MEGPGPAFLFSPRVSAVASADVSFERQTNKPFPPFSPMDTSTATEHKR